MRRIDIMDAVDATDQNASEEVYPTYEEVAENSRAPTQSDKGTTILCGGPLGGEIVPEWPVGTFKEFTAEDGQVGWYRNDETAHAVFVGTEEPKPDA
jgi:hypothetical protein